MAVASNAALKARQPGGSVDLPHLMSQYQAGDPAAIEELVQRLSRGLLRFLTWSGANGNAEDLLQECWIRIHRARHTYRAPEPVLPWIYAIARHTRLDAYRRWRRREAREVLMAELPEVRLPDEPSDRFAEQRFARMLDHLPASQREILVMLKVSGMTLEETARATGLTIGAVKQKAHRALRFASGSGAPYGR
jgi:RNA polymerase sigma-70 factor (ECF subfamily)